MPTNNYPGIGYSRGRDFNYFQKYTVTETGFGAASVDGYQPCLIIPFTTQGVVFTNEGTGIVEVSFNGTTVHDELNPSLVTKAAIYDNRVISKIWFRIQSGSSGPVIVSVRAWGS